MRFKAVHLCKTCKKQLSFNTVMGSHGVCPLCGASSGSTVVSTVTESVEVVELGEEAVKHIAAQIIAARPNFILLYLTVSGLLLAFTIWMVLYFNG